MKTIGIGIAGAQLGARMHVANYANLPAGHAEIRGVCAKTLSSAKDFANKAGIDFATDNYDALLARPDIDLIDVCVPPALHHEFAIRAAQAGKHIIMEKPLTGYFGSPGDAEPIGEHVERSRMRKGAKENAEAIREAVQRNGVQFCYAENWVYSPPIVKMRKLIAASKGSILEIRAEENHSGSNSKVSKEWKSTGGGALLRMGVHSVGACLHLKQWEGQIRRGKPILPVAVIADTTNLIDSEASERARKADAHRWISSNPADVENWANVIIHFDDGSRGIVTVSDSGLGGLNTRVAAYMTDGVIKANMTANDGIETFAPTGDIFGEEYFTEKLETRAGWNRPSCDEDWFRGFAQEIADFIHALRNGKQPLTGIDLAVSCVDVIYAAYQSAQEGRRIPLT